MFERDDVAASFQLRIGARIEAGRYPMNRYANALYEMAAVFAQIAGEAV
jgi:hypothetical protein